MAKTKQRFDLNSLMAGIAVVIVSIVVAFAAHRERPQQTQTPFEMYVRAEAALRSSGMP